MVDLLRVLRYGSEWNSSCDLRCVEGSLRGTGGRVMRTFMYCGASVSSFSVPGLLVQSSIELLQVLSLAIVTSPAKEIFRPWLPIRTPLDL